ncbi:MAG: 30S ribosomal protein S6 [Acidobacteria bacterium]|nr:30S ribosomal protein S6 [Acidobacteriota bacterium]
MANRTNEVMYIATPEASDDTIVKLNDAIVKLIEKEGGSVVKTDDWGRRKLAYPIKKKTEGYYVLFEVEGSGQEIAELERRMRVNDLIMRYITVRVDEDRKAADKKQAKRDRRRNRGGESETAETEANQ